MLSPRAGRPPPPPLPRAGAPPRGPRSRGEALRPVPSALARRPSPQPTPRARPAPLGARSPRPAPSARSSRRGPRGDQGGNILGDAFGQLRARRPPVDLGAKAARLVHLPEIAELQRVPEVDLLPDVPALRVEPAQVATGQHGPRLLDRLGEAVARPRRGDRVEEFGVSKSDSSTPFTLYPYSRASEGSQ